MNNTELNLDKFEQQLFELLYKNESFLEFVTEANSQAADQAKKMGLTSMGFGRWGKDGEVTHTTKDGRIQPVRKAQPPKTTPSKPKPTPVTKPAQPRKSPVTPAALKQPTKPPQKPAPQAQAQQPTPQRQQRFRNWQARYPSVTSRVIDKVRAFKDKTRQEAREFFEQELHRGKTPERRRLGQAIRDKIKGAWKAIKKGAKHEAAEFRDAGRGIRSLFRGKKPNRRERHAMIGVATKIVSTALFGAALGHAAHGLAAFGKHVIVDFIPHVVGETVLKGTSKAALFAEIDAQMSDDEMMEKFIEMVVKNFEEMDIPKEILYKAIMSYNGEE